MKKTVIGTVGIILLLFIFCCSLAEDTLTFTQGVKLVLFDKNGVKVYLTGEVEDTGLSIISLPAVIENNTDHAICVSYQGTGNGWTISRSVFGNSGSNVAKKAKSKTFMWFEYDALDIKRFSELESVELTFSIEKPIEGFGLVGETYFTVEDVTIDFAGGGEAVREMTWFKECPALPTPLSFVDVYESGSGSSSMNGKTTAIYYKYKPVSNQDSASALLTAYIDGLKANGCTVKGSGSYQVYSGSTKLCDISIKNGAIQIDIVPGTDKITQKPNAAAGQQTAAVSPAAKTYAIGETLKAGTATFKLEQQGTASKLYSYTDSKPSRFYHYTAEDGSAFFYIRGTFKNTGTHEVDIRNIYLEATFDGKYAYSGSAVALRSDGTDFLNTVSAQKQATAYFYFEVPSTVLNSYKTCTVKAGFTKDFDIRVKSNGLYKFELCDDIFDIDCSKSASSSASAVSSTKAPAASQKTSGGDESAAPQQTDAGENEIRFQKIAWGSSSEETRKALAKCGLLKNSSDMNAKNFAVADVIAAKPNPQLKTYMDFDDVSTKQTATSFKSQIAGYDVKSVTAVYAYEVANKKVDKKTTHLLSVNVELKSKDIVAAFKDLSSKLTSVYGKATKTFYETSEDGMRMWQGDNNTAVILLCIFSEVKLVYGTIGDYETLQSLQKTLADPVDANNTSGL